VYWKRLQEVVSRLQAANESYAPAMQLLAQVFALSILQNPHHPSLCQALPFSTSRQKSLRAAYANALDELATRYVVDIIVAYGFTEYELDSALARADQTP
jgi:acyl-CoA oxidase